MKTPLPACLWLVPHAAPLGSPAVTVTSLCQLSGQQSKSHRNVLTRQGRPQLQSNYYLWAEGAGYQGGT